MPSECYEGQPYGALESMAVGKPRAAAMGERAWSYAREQFSPARQVEHLVALYEQVVADAAERRRTLKI